MYPTQEQMAALRPELHEWFERYELLEGLLWRRANEHHEQESENPEEQYYWILIYEDSDFYYVLNSYAAADANSEIVRTRPSELFVEFEAIVRRHGLYFERIDNVSVSFWQSGWDEADA